MVAAEPLWSAITVLLDVKHHPSSKLGTKSYILLTHLEKRRALGLFRQASIFCQTCRQLTLIVVELGCQTVSYACIARGADTGLY